MDDAAEEATHQYEYTQKKQNESLSPASHVSPPSHHHPNVTTTSKRPDRSLSRQGQEIQRKRNVISVYKVFAVQCMLQKVVVDNMEAVVRFIVGRISGKAARSGGVIRSLI